MRGDNQYQQSEMTTNIGIVGMTTGAGNIRSDNSTNDSRVTSSQENVPDNQDD